MGVTRRLGPVTPKLQCSHEEDFLLLWGCSACYPAAEGDYRVLVAGVLLFYIHGTRDVITDRSCVRCRSRHGSYENLNVSLGVLGFGGSRRDAVVTVRP
jgi:hypothetical protein